MKKLIVFSVSLLTSTAVLACSNVFWNSNEGVVVSRTMDWMSSTKPTLTSYREGKHKVLAVLGYGYVAEGVNEFGLQGSIQYYSEMSLPKYEGKEHDVNQMELLGYLLANYKTVNEVVERVNTLRVGLSAMDELPEIPLFHYIFSDKSGGRALLQYDQGGLRIYQEKDAYVVTNTPQQDNIKVGAEAQESINKQGYTRNTQLNMGNAGSEQRYVYSSYFLSQLQDASSATNAMMKVEGTAFKVPQDAAYKPNTAMSTYATEYGITYNLKTGDVVFKYTGADHWEQQSWNFYDLMDKEINKPLYK